MNKKLFDELFNKSYLRKDSKLCISCDKNKNVSFEIKNLSIVGCYFFLYVLIEQLKNEKIIKKEVFVNLINDLL